MFFSTDLYRGVGFSELKMRESHSGPDISAEATFTASGYRGPPPSSVRTPVGWNSNGFFPVGIAWLKCDFGNTPKSLAEISITCPPYVGNHMGGAEIAPNNAPITALVQYSDDDVTYRTQRAFGIRDVDNWVVGTTCTFDVSPLPASAAQGGVIGKLNAVNCSPQGIPGNPRYTPGSPEESVLPVPFRLYTDAVSGGEYRIAGTTTVLGNPAPRKVRLYDQVTGRLSREQNTGEDGLFEFRNIALGPWTVVGIDDTGTHNGVIYTHVSAIPM